MNAPARRASAESSRVAGHHAGDWSGRAGEDAMDPSEHRPLRRVASAGIALEVILGVGALGCGIALTWIRQPGLLARPEKES
jgi:hypothetical protein